MFVINVDLKNSFKKYKTKMCSKDFDNFYSTEDYQ